jgi:hypothetical protein
MAAAPCCRPKNGRASLLYSIVVHDRRRLFKPPFVRRRRRRRRRGAAHCRALCDERVGPHPSSVDANFKAISVRAQQPPPPQDDDDDDDARPLNPIAKDPPPSRRCRPERATCCWRC